MLSYELCLKLKKAGFPQPDENYDGFYVREDGHKELDHYGHELPYRPTLSEFIEECVGIMHGDFHLVSWADRWICGDYSNYVQDWLAHRAAGQAPEEAVAYLYLNIKLND